MMPNRIPANPRSDTAHQLRDRLSTSTTGTRMSHPPLDQKLRLDSDPSALLSIRDRYGDLQDTIAEERVDPTLVGTLRQRDGSEEGTVAHFGTDQALALLP